MMDQMAGYVGALDSANREQAGGYIIRPVMPRGYRNPDPDYKALLAMIVGAILGKLAYDAYERRRTGAYGRMNDKFLEN